MSVDQPTLLHVARLARLRLDESALQRSETQLNALLGVLDSLQAIDTTGVEPLFHPGDLDLRLRDDQALPVTDATRLAIQANAPELGGDLYLVPKVIEAKSS